MLDILAISGELERDLNPFLFTLPAYFLFAAKLYFAYELSYVYFNALSKTAISPVDG